ncbi:putative mitochondrial protein [Dendrobium catenatum]|uniref:Putative mitochondrial protein n=1 Tax=Dendrobium catenatum TaxID=906689 RepID=A0A2I0WPB4_9ASPA|nr:putative mitochondrial protein [Dendrobium catenatum]
MSLKRSTGSASTEDFSDPQLYRKIAGSLQYLSITRPDIAFTTNYICQRMHKPSVDDFQTLKRLLRYVQGTTDLGIPIDPGDLQLRAFADADWAADSSDRRSITEFCTFLGNTIISWSAKKQVTVAKSSTEAEYRSISSATSEVIWLRRLLAELRIPQIGPTPLHCDNTSAIALANNPIFHARTKHIEIDYHFISDHIKAGDLNIIHISSAHQIADILTKSLPKERFLHLRNKLNIRSKDD